MMRFGLHRAAATAARLRGGRIVVVRAARGLHAVRVRAAATPGTAAPSAAPAAVAKGREPPTAPSPAAVAAYNARVHSTHPSLNAPVTTLRTGKFLELASRAYGRGGAWEFARRPNARGVVVIIPVTRAGELLLVEQFRPPLNAAVLELPAGLVGDHDVPGAASVESMADACVRELREETGYALPSAAIAKATAAAAAGTDVVDSGPSTDVGVPTGSGCELVLVGPSSAGLTNELKSFYLVWGLERVDAAPHGDGDERITLHRVPLPDVHAYCVARAADGLMVDYKIHAALWLLARRGFVKP